MCHVFIMSDGENWIELCKQAVSFSNQNNNRLEGRRGEK